MDGFGAQFFGDELADLSLELQIDPTDELLSMDADPGFNNFLLELAEDPLPSFDNIPIQEAASCDGSPQLVGGKGVMESSSPPRSPCSSGQESCPVVGASDLLASSGPVSNAPSEEVQRDRRAKLGESEEARSLRVKERNRLYAARTRQRKTRLMQDLRQRCNDLENENSRLRGVVAEQQAELDMLRVLKFEKQNPDPQLVSEIPDTVSGDGTPSPEPCSTTQAVPTQPCLVPGSTVTAHVRTMQPNQKAKNKLRFTAAAAVPPATQCADKPQLSARGDQPRGELHSGCTGSIRVAENGPMVVLSESTKDACSFGEAISVDTGKRPLETEHIQSRRRVRGRINLPGKGLPRNAAAMGILALFALSCVLLLAFPAMVAVFPSTPDDGSFTNSLQKMALHYTSHSSRSLLDDSQRHEDATSLVPYEQEYFLTPGSSPDAQHRGIVATSSVAQQVLQTAKFVCNHSACVAISSDGSWAHAVPQVPVRVRGESSNAGVSMQKTVLSALENVAPISHRLVGEIDAQDGPSRTKHLRGGEEPANVDSGKTCLGDGCEYFKHSGHVLSRAGLLEPDVCTVVHRVEGGSHSESGGKHRSKAMRSSGRSTGVGSWKNPRVGGGEVSLSSHHQEASISHLSTTYSSQDYVTGGSDGAPGRLVSVLLPAWKLQAEEKGVMTPMMSIFVLVSEGEDLLTYECSLSRTLYI